LEFSAPLSRKTLAFSIHAPSKRIVWVWYEPQRRKRQARRRDKAMGRGAPEFEDAQLRHRMGHHQRVVGKVPELCPIILAPLDGQGKGQCNRARTRRIFPWHRSMEMCSIEARPAPGPAPSPRD
jgi:hypothetical protein